MNGSRREPCIGNPKEPGREQGWAELGEGMLGDFTPWQAIALFLLWAWG